MKIKDIVNRDIVNLTNCEHEPIHIPGSVQPHGFLLALCNKAFTIDYCSGNLQDFVPMVVDQVLGKTFSTVFGAASAQQLEAYISKKALLSAGPLKIDFFDTPFICHIHDNGQCYILEAEPTEKVERNLTDVYSQTLQFVSYMNQTATLKGLCEMVAKGTREITGYDRVMVYRFDKEYNGEVFAESCRDDLEPFLGLHYPHTDIPVQARELYMKNQLRLIVDINYKPVPIYTLDDAPGKNLDLSYSTLRSTSPIHVEYLQNMGVGATLTISLIHRGRLWGLIACHHYAAKNLTAEIKLSARLQGQFITSQIDVRESNEEYEVARKTNMALERLTAQNLPPVLESFKIISLNPDLLRTCNANGVSISISGNLYCSGVVPDASDIIKLSKWLENYTNGSSFFTDKLVFFLPDEVALTRKVSGILYHSLGNGNHIIWYRPETRTEVNWGGDPNKAIIKDENGLHPRNSFNLWKQIIRNRSNDWLQPEVNTAANYAHALQKQISILLLAQEEEKQRLLTEELKGMNAELENINWISTHDLQEPLRKIQLISSRLLAKKDEGFSEMATDSLLRMNQSAGRMQTLLIDILKYTRIKYTEEAFEMVSLDAVLQQVLEETREFTKEHHGVVTVAPLPVIHGVPFLLQQLFSNLILNSLKYASTARDPRIAIKQIDLQDKAFYHIEVQDNGIGFDAKYSDSIFNIFTRLHNQTEYKGSGVGLALCRKIMQTHKGHISAIGREGNGATFKLSFPKPV